MTPSRASPLQQTKLRRPLVPVDVMHRQELHDTLEQGSRLPLTLVSAPAGYGKTTVVSDWLETRGDRSAWLSLDESDSDPVAFLSYVVAAVRTVFPAACGDTLAQLHAASAAHPAALAGVLSNDLDDLEERLILALDDYQNVHAPDVHELVDRLVAHPAAPVHLAVISRRDPPLSLGTLRAHGMLGEVRSRDLLFTESETAAFFEQAGHALDGSALRSLHDALEGWPVGLRLAAAALRHHGDADELLQGLAGERGLREYLLESILSRQPPAMRDRIRRTSILDRFCAPLCEAVFRAEAHPAHRDSSGSAFLRSLHGTGLPVTRLDQAGQWYRYHHLVQDLLRHELESRLAPAEIAGLHRRAQEWLEDQELLNEAVSHAEKADGAAGVGRLIVRHRNRILNEERFHLLDRWLRRLPREVIEEDGELLMLRAWQLQNRGSYAEAFATLDRIEELVASDPKERSPSARIRGGIEALRSAQRYNEGNGELSRTHAEQALRLLPPDCLSERGYALIYSGGARQMCGDLEGARKLIYDEMARLSGPADTFYGRLCLTLCFMSWIAADLKDVRLMAARCIEAGDRQGLAELSLVGNWFEGMVSYQQNRLAEAHAHLMPAVTARRIPNLEYYLESAFALSCVHQAMGRENDARETLDAASDRLVAFRSSTLLQRAQAYQADLALRQGRVAEAVKWARGLGPQPPEAMYRFQEPPIVRAKVLLAEGSAESQEQAGLLLTQLEEFLEKTHSTRLLIEVLALQELLRGARGKDSAADERLGRAVSLAQPGGLISVFRDLGPELAGPLSRVEADEESLQYIGRILAAFRNDQAPTTAGTRRVRSEWSADRHPSVAPLTARELEILELLAKRLSDKEIARELYISPGTVKRHNSTIFSKLGVHDRRKAVAKAVGLGLLS